MVSDPREHRPCARPLFCGKELSSYPASAPYFGLCGSLRRRHSLCVQFYDTSRNSTPFHPWEIPSRMDRGHNRDAGVSAGRPRLVRTFQIRKAVCRSRSRPRDQIPAMVARPGTQNSATVAGFSHRRSHRRALHTPITKRVCGFSARANKEGEDECFSSYLLCLKRGNDLSHPMVRVGRALRFSNRAPWYSITII